MQRRAVTQWEEVFGGLAPHIVDAAHRGLAWRAVDWRFRAAQVMMQRKRRGVQCADEWFVHAWHFARWLQKAKSHGKPLDTIRPVKPFRSSWAAYRIYEEAHVRKCEIEARILANESSSTIADMMRIDESTAKAYELLFFDARDRLRAGDFISGTVLRIDDEIDPRETGRVWAFFACHGGAQVLQALIDDLKARGEEDYRYFMRPQHDVERTPMQRKLSLSILLRLLPRDDRLAAMEIMRTRRRLAHEDKLDQLCKWPKMGLKAIIENTVQSMLAKTTVKTAAAA
jgi:hypothetical protein